MGLQNTALFCGSGTVETTRIITKSRNSLLGSYMLSKVILPALHIKLGLMKHLVKALDKGAQVINHLKAKFPKLSEAKLKESIFVGPQKRKLLKEPTFNAKLINLELVAWSSFKAIVLLGQLKRR